MLISYAKSHTKFLDLILIKPSEIALSNVLLEFQLNSNFVVKRSSSL